MAFQPRFDSVRWMFSHSGVFLKVTLTAFVFLAGGGLGVAAQPLEILDCSSGTYLGVAGAFDCANSTGGSSSYSIIAAPFVLNPVTTADSASSDVHDHIFGTFKSTYSLLAGGATGLVPRIASVIELSEDGSAVTYTIRDGLQYSDGSAFSMDDIIYWYEDVVLNPNLTNPSNDAFICATTGDPFTLATDSDNPLSLTISCPNTFRTFSMNAATTYVMSKQMALDLIDDLGIATEAGVNGPRATVEFLGLGADISLIRGLGPYIMTDFDSQSVARFERNPFFYEVDSNGTQLPYLDTLEVIIIPTAGQNLGLSNFLAGQTDLLRPRPADIAPILGQAAGGGFGINADIDNGTAAPGTTFVTINYDDPSPGLSEVARNKNVRHALSLAIDRVAATNNVLLGIGAPQFLPITLNDSTGTQVLSTFFVGRNNTCATFASLTTNCDDASGLMTVRTGLQVQVHQIPPLGLTPELDELVGCLFDQAACDATANAILDSEGLVDTDGDGTRNLTTGENWQIAVTTNTGNTTREGYTQIICDGWIELNIECSANSTSFGTLVSQLLGLGGATWSGGIVIGLSGGDPSGGQNAYQCGATLYFWHLSCDPSATSGSTAQLPEDAEMEIAFDAGYVAVSVAEAQAGFDEWQIQWSISEPFMHIAVANALFAVRTDRLCNDNRAIVGFTDVKFRLDVSGNAGACNSNVGRFFNARNQNQNPTLPPRFMVRGTCTVRLTPW